MSKISQVSFAELFYARYNIFNYSSISREGVACDRGDDGKEGFVEKDHYPFFDAVLLPFFLFCHVHDPGSLERGQ